MRTKKYYIIILNTLQYKWFSSAHLPERRDTKRVASADLFKIDEDYVIDATKKGNIARFINHCCDVSIRMSVAEYILLLNEFVSEL